MEGALSNIRHPCSSKTLSLVAQPETRLFFHGARGLCVCVSRHTYDRRLFDQCSGGALEEAVPLLPRLLVRFVGSDVTSSQNSACKQLRQLDVPHFGNTPLMGACAILNLSPWHLLRRGCQVAADAQELSQYS